MLLEDIVEVALVAEPLLGDAGEQTRLGRVHVTLLTLDDSLGLIAPEDDGVGLLKMTFSMP